jgi:hypothetical protein
VILLSLVLVVVSATTLGFGVFDSSEELVWASLVAGLGAVALIAGSVVRRRRQLVPGAVADVAGPSTGGVVAVGSASAGVDPAPSPTPARPAEPASGPVSPPGLWAGPPSESAPSESLPSELPPSGSAPSESWTGAQTWPWATTPPGGPPDSGSRPGWTGPVPAVTPPADDGTAPADFAGGGTPAADFAGGGTPAADAAGATSSADVAGGGTRAAHTGATSAADAAAAWDAGAPSGAGAAEPGDDGEPGVERLAVRDALRVAQLNDEVVVVDGHPRYHLADCPTLAGAETMPLAVSVARRGGFTPCAVCGPDAALLARSRARSAERTNDGR